MSWGEWGGWKGRGETHVDFDVDTQFGAGGVFLSCLRPFEGAVVSCASLHKRHVPKFSTVQHPVKRLLTHTFYDGIRGQLLDEAALFVCVEVEVERMGCRGCEEDGAEGEERSSHCREEVREEEEEERSKTWRCLV